VFIPLWTLIFTVLFMLQQTFFANKEITVAIPVAKMEAPVQEKKIQVKPRVSTPKVLEEKQVYARGAIPRESYPRMREEMIVEKKPVQEGANHEIVPAEEEKHVQMARERYLERMKQKEQDEKQEATAQREAKWAQKEEPSARPIEEHRQEISDRQKRYMERRGEMIEEVKTNMFQTSEKKERDRYEKELFKESAPSPEISLEESSKGLDVEDIEKFSSLDELGELGLGGLGELGSKELEELAGIAEPEKIPKQKGLVCPKCGSKKSTIVYCPYCGKGFCSNCSDKIERKGNLVFYMCSSCKKDVIVKEA
jgi:hypothetical protein